MATDASLSNFIPNISLTTVLNWIIIILLLIIALSLISWYFYRRWKSKRYGQYKIVIWEKDTTGNTHEYYDRGGIFLDKKTGYKLLFLEKMKKGLNPNNVPYITSKDKKGRLVKTVYLRRIGVSNYVYCHVKLEEGVLFTVGEEDVNWAAQDIETIRRTFNKEGWLTKYAPYMTFVVTIMIIMIILLSLFNKFGVLETTAENLDKVAQTMSLITERQYNITQNLNMNPGQPIIVPGVR